MKILRVLAVLTVLCCSPAALAGMPVEIQAQATDPVGQALARAVQEQIRQSSVLEAKAPGAGLRLRAHFLSMDGHGTGGQATSYALVVTFAREDAGPGLYVQAIQGVCGATRVKACARDLVRELAGVSGRFQAALALSDPDRVPDPLSVP